MTPRTDLPRTDMARRQEELVRSLVAGGSPPAGFDVERLRMAENTLLRKRCGEVARHIPLVRARLGGVFVVEFMAWARGRERGGSAADAQAFTTHLTALGLWETPRRRRTFGSLLRRSAR